MPWNSQLAQVLAICEQARIITTPEYNNIRSLMEGTHVLLATEEFIKQKSAVAEQATDGGDSSQSIIGSTKPSGFKFGAASQKELVGVKIELQRMAHRALELSSQDFCVFDGLRTVKEQEQHVKNGNSRTMNSKHLKGLALDLVPWVNGKPVWDWDRIYPIVLAVDQAATEQRIAHKIKWGGAWDRTLADYGGDSKAYYNECQAYQRRHEGKDFIDGPHFEWVD